MAGIFAEWQPRYAEHGIATFPVRDKKPAVANYLKMGLPASRKLVTRFSDADALGFACRRNRIAVLDIDSPDERLLADALREFGPSPFIVQSGSGNFQAWYCHSGQRRSVRPDKERPIDILGDGYVVAPPSTGAKGSYRIICGSLDDLASLPPMLGRFPGNTKEASSKRIGKGARNNTLWRECMKWAIECCSEAELLRRAIEFNKACFLSPLTQDEIRKIVGSAWKMKLSGQNWFDGGGRVVIEHNEVDGLMNDQPDAFILLTKLRRHHWNREFRVANKMAETMPRGWTVKRFAAARRHLEIAGLIEMVRPASNRYGPALYRHKGGRF